MTSSFRTFFKRRSATGETASLPTSASSRSERLKVGALSFVTLCLVYLYSVAPGLGMCHDTGELTTCCIIQGVPHSPGYPLFVAIGWLAQQMPFGTNPAYRLNCLCAVEVALAMGVLGAALSRAVRPFPALIATLLVGLSVPVWRQAVVTEVFSLHLLFLACLVNLALAWEESEDPKRREILIWAGFLIGCELAHQHTIALSAPAFIVFGILAKGRGRIWGFNLLSYLVLLVAAVAPYLLQMYLARQEPDLNWGNVQTLEALKNHFLRKSYGTGLLNSASLTYDSRAGLAQASAYFIGLVRNYFPLPSFLLLGFALDRGLWRGPTPRLIFFLGLALLNGPLFALAGNQPSEEFFSDLMERFYASSLLGLGGLIAYGAAWLLDSTPEHHRKALRLSLMILPAISLMLNYPKCSQRGQHHAEDLLNAIFLTVPQRSGLIVGGDLTAGAAEYLTNVQGKGQGIIILYPGLITGDWYRERLSRAIAKRAVEGEKKGGAADALKSVFDYLTRQGWQAYTNDLGSKMKGFFLRDGFVYRYYPNAKLGPKLKDYTPHLKDTFAALESSPRRGNYRLDWRQNYWTRYCIQQWVSAYKSLAEQFTDLEPELAIICLTRVTEMQQSPEVETYLNRAALLVSLKRYREATSDLRVVLRLNERSKPALVLMVMAYEGLGDKDKAAQFRFQLQNLGG